MTWYTVLKVVHVLSVIVWIGAVTTVSGITSFLAGARDRVTLAAWLPYATRYGQRVAGPASILVLLSGIAMVIVGGIGFKALWVSLGFAGIIVHIAFGATVLRVQGARFAALLRAGGDDAAVVAAARRMVLGNAIYLLLMASVVAVMVFKPTV
jgi:uncharacterized membrane protein